ncbi:MAG: DUF2341 domain-containing protein [Burkholderiaceae bacterium]|nr:DUF2341 domain-containing protein [Burkholderiaceae bacterium]
MRNVLISLAFAAATVLPSSAHAWWSKDWTQRTRITLNTSAQGLETKEPASNVSVAVRLHSGNFDFAAAKEDGSDLRLLAGDDKTPLKFSVERFDGINELAVLWVQVPVVAPGSEKNAIYVYAGNAKAGAEAAEAGAHDAATLAAIQFSDKESQGVDARAGLKAAAPVAIDANGLLAASARLDGTAIVWPGSDKLKVEAGGAVTISLWLKPEFVNSGTVLQWGPLMVRLAAGKVGVRVGKTELIGGGLAPNVWTQLALTLGGGKAQLYINGVAADQAELATPALAGELRLGDGVKGQADALLIASTVRSAEWLLVAAGAQGAQSKLVASLRETGDAAEGEGSGHFAVLIKNLTTDAWVVIIVLALMFVVATWVIVSKARFVGRADKANRSFLGRFRGATHDLLTLEQGGAHPNSPLFRLYTAGVRELAKRKVGEEGAKALSGASLSAVRAAVDADLVRESHRLNSQMVLLTIAISGGPFIGLLGTVLGVMITFAAIAAAGDVNVNAIAPGIAAALLATVAGLAVAIPALFAYNYLASRIKNISADMQIFVDEFTTRVAEIYGAP